MCKLINIVAVLLILLNSCGNETPSAEEHNHHAIDNEEVYINGEELHHYYLPNTFKVESYLVEVIQDSTTFSQYLHPAATMDAKFRNIDYQKEFVLVVAGKSSELTPHFNIESIQKSGSTLHVHLKEVKDSVANSYSITPVLAYSFPKEGISKIMVAINDYTTEKSVN